MLPEIQLPSFRGQDGQESYQKSTIDHSPKNGGSTRITTKYKSNIDVFGHDQKEVKRSFVLKTIENDGRAKAIGSGVASFNDAVYQQVDLQDKLQEHRKILTTKLNSSSTVHTDLTGLKTKLSVTRDATRDQQRSKQSMIIHELANSTGSVEDTCTLRSGSVTQQRHIRKGSIVKFMKPMVTISQQPSPKSQFRADTLSRQEHSPSAGCLKRKDLSTFVLHKIIKSPETNVINNAREKINRSVQRNKTIDFPHQDHQVKAHLNSSIERSRGPQIQRTPLQQMKIDDNNLLFFNKTIINEVSKNKFIPPNAFSANPKNVSPKMHSFMATLEGQYGEHSRLLECLNRQKEEKLKVVEQSLAETREQKNGLENQVHKFAKELQDQKVSSEVKETSLNQMSQKQTSLIHQNAIMKDECERLQTENARLKDSHKKLDKKLRDTEAQQKYLAMDMKVQKIQMDWADEDVSKYQDQNSKFQKLIVEYEEKLSKQNSEIQRLQKQLTLKQEKCHLYKVQLTDQQEKEMIKQKQEDIQEQLKTKIAQDMDAKDRRGMFKPEGEERQNVNQDLLIKKLDKQIKTLKAASDKQTKNLAEQLELSQNANSVMKKQCQLLNKQMESQMKQADAIIDQQKKEITSLLDSNINHGIKLLHNDFKARMEVLKQKKQESYLASVNGHQDEMIKLKQGQKQQRENHIKQLKQNKLPGSKNPADEPK